MLTTLLRRGLVAVCASVFFAAPAARGVLAAPVPVGSPSLAGRVTSADGAPVPNAGVILRGSDGEHTALTDRAGRFTFDELRPGSYAVRVTAAGYEPLESSTLGIGTAPQVVTLSMARSSSSLLTIGRVQASGGDALSTSSVPSTTINAQTYADEGFTRISDVLQDDISTTLVHPLGGGSTILPTSVALRGPDPTETLVDIDGHQVNNGNTGDFDLSLLDPADFSSIELVKGISPSSLVGPDTIDGAINIRTLEPTVNPHGLARFTVGSYDSFAETLERTGTAGRLGYALSLHRTTSAGEVDQSIFDQTTGANAQVGSAVDASTALGKLRFAFGRTGDSYAEFSFHDQSQFRDLSAALSSVPAPGGDASSDSIASTVLDGLEGTALQSHNAGYAIDVRVPLGNAGRSGIADTSLLYRHYTSLVSESVTGPGADSSPYLYDSRDAIGDDSLEIDRRFAQSVLTLQLDIRNENLLTAFTAGVVNDQRVARGTSAASLRRFGDTASGSSGATSLGLGQTQRSAVLRYAYDPTDKVHLTAALYDSDYSIFGQNLDPRFGFTFDPDARTVVRFSVGTTFQAPQLPELYVPPTLPDAVGGYVSVGNPNLQPDHATEYGFGVQHIFETGAARTDVSADLYRVNLRAPASTYLPALDPNCGAVSEGGDGTACPLSYPVNAGDGIYQGIELAGSRRIAADTVVRAGYAVRSAYLTAVPPSIQDGTLVVGEQALGLPLQKWTLSIRKAPLLGFGYSAGIVYEGLYNELDQPQFATVAAGLSYRWRSYDINVYGTNLTNLYDQRFTHQGAGLPYGGIGGPIPTDAYALEGTAVNVSLTRRF